MIGKPDHLTDEAGDVLAESIDERVYFIRSKRWIPYPKALEILGHLNALLKHPRTTRMPSLAVYGDSGMGKSMLVEKFKDDYALSAREKPHGPKAKLLVVELAGRPNERRLFAQILAVLGAPQNPRALLVQTWRPCGANGREPAVGWALGTIFPDFDNLARPIKRRINHAAVAALPISFRPALLASISRTIANPTILNVVRDDTILRGRRASSACARQPVSKLKQRGEATKRENIRAYILTYHGFFDSESDILKPRWLPTCGSTCLKCRDRGKLKK